jgi:nitroreductase
VTGCITEHATPNTTPPAADLFEIIRTTRSRRRVKPDPVPNDLIRKILEAAVCAPSGGNMQRWRFLVIKDPAIKETVEHFETFLRLSPREHPSAHLTGIGMALFMKRWFEDAAAKLLGSLERVPATTRGALLLEERYVRWCLRSRRLAGPLRVSTARFLPLHAQGPKVRCRIR